LPRDRFDHLDPEKQQRLFEAAAEEFGSHGFERASLNRIIDRAGMSKGSLYYYFDDKGDLYATLVEKATTKLVQLVAGFRLDELTAESFWPSLEGAVRRSAAYLNRNEWFVRLGRSFYRVREGAGRASSTRVFSWIRRWTATVLRRGQALGVVRTDLPLDLLVELALAVGEAGDRWLLDHWKSMTKAERERMLAAEMNAFHRLLEPLESGVGSRELRVFSRESGGGRAAKRRERR
jgi:AcrR family transcriptional regulator